jgi:hypothetical protein
VDGLAVVNADHETRRLDLYWKGDLPEPLRSTVERVRERFTVPSTTRRTAGPKLPRRPGVSWRRQRPWKGWKAWSRQRQSTI